MTVYWHENDLQWRLDDDMLCQHTSENGYPTKVIGNIFETPNLIEELSI